MYMCVAGLDHDYDAKFSAIKSILENGISNTPGFPCRLEVINTMPYAESQDPNIPCTGILREYNDPAKVGGDPSGAPNWAWEMPGFMAQAILIATQVEPHGEIVNSFRASIEIALCSNLNGTRCHDMI